MMSMVNEFKRFMVRRRIMDLAAGTVVGAAFGKVITSFVHDVVLPPVGAFTSGVDISSLSYVIKKAQGTMPPVAIAYGRLIQTTIDFAIVAIAVSLALKIVDSLTMAEEEKTPKAANEEALLREIRDLLLLQKDRPQEMRAISDPAEP